MESTSAAILKKDIERNPTNFHLIKQLGDICFAQGQYKEAVKQYSIACNYDFKLCTNIILNFEKEILSNPQNVNAHLGLVYFYLEQGAEKEALFELYELIEREQKEVKIYELLLKVLKKNDRQEAAINLLNRAIEEGLYENIIVDSLKEIYLDKGCIEEAITLFKKITKGAPDNINFLRDLAELYYMNEECKKSVEVYKNIVNLSPSTIPEAINHVLKIIKTKDDNVSYHQLLGDWFLKSLKPHEAVREYSTVFQKDSGNLSLAMENFKKVLNYYPHFTPACFSLAEVYVKQGSFSEAVVEYNNILKKQPHFASEVIWGLEEILKNFPRQVLAAQSLALAYWDIGEKRKAITYMNKWLDLTSEGVEEVIDKCDHYIRYEEDNLEVMELLARAYFLGGHNKKAAEEARKILAVDNSNLSSLTILTEIHKKEGHLVKAKDLLLKAREINPSEYGSFIALKEIKLRILTDKINRLIKEIKVDKTSLKYYLDLGLNNFYIGKIIDAISFLQKASEDRHLAKVAHFQLGECFKEYGRFDLSLDQYAAALNVITDFSCDKAKLIIFKIGLANEALGRLKEAQESYERILKVDISFKNLKERLLSVDRSYALGLRGKMLAGVFNSLKDNRFIPVYVKNREDEEFIKGKRKKSARNLSFGQDHNDKGVDKFLSGMIQAAGEEFLLAEELDGKLTSVKNNLGLIYLAHGDLSKARIKFEEAININKNLAVLYNNLALTHHLAKDYAMAQKLYEFALKQDNQLTIINLNLGDMYFHQGLLSESLILWKKAVEQTVLPELARRRMLAGELTFV